MPAATEMGLLDFASSLFATEAKPAGLDEAGRRGCDPRLVDWLRGGGQAPFPFGCRYSGARPAPNGWRSYFGQLYHG